MKNLLKIAVIFALTCGIASAIGIEWGVTGLTLDGGLATPSGETANYGTELDQFVLQLVFVGDGSMSGGMYNTMDVVQTGYIPKVPFVQAGTVQGVTTSVGTGTYMLLLYNTTANNFYGLSSTADGLTALNSSFEITGTEPVIDPQEFKITDGSIYQGALVPEPSTAALALAGIALLFRRKRA